MLSTRTRRVFLIGATIATASGLWVMAQEGGGPGGPPHGQRPKHPLEVALDANGDGTIDATEIANAAAALKKLDKNGDGKLAADEYRPQHPPGMGPGQGQGQEGPPPAK